VVIIRKTTLVRWPLAFTCCTNGVFGNDNHTVTIELSGDETQTLVSLSQDNNPTEEARKHSEENWKTMLANLKKFLEE